MPKNKRKFNWSDQVILLTGGTGSFGQGFTEKLLRSYPPKVLRIFSRDEFKQSQMQRRFNHKCLRYFIGDVRDRERLKRAMENVTLVVHAAAMKQIVACEYNPREAIYTNIFGSLNVIETAIETKVKKVLALSTDKSVIPINLYGATKLCAEKIFIQGNVYAGGGTKISCVRYGNVAASRGSVIPVFNEQVKSGKLNITDQRMTRFWISLSEATKFVIESIEIMQGEEVFIPKMPSFRILDLAKAIAPKAKIEFIGIRPGEKLHEDLITKYESQQVYDCGTYYTLSPVLSIWGNKIKQGKKITDQSFSYNSETNTDWLTEKKLTKILKSMHS